jgi:beta-1,4-mannosyl-glycoprotein beta-1,4-N-acetylglucosaminyltransferase
MELVASGEAAHHASMCSRDQEMTRLFDCFTFFNELDALEIRLNELDDTVDYFVLCESTKTFKGAEKQLVFGQNADRFANFAHKIRHVVVSDMPDEARAWEREQFQRNQIKRGLSDLASDDFVVISDVDEIVRASILREVYNCCEVVIFDMAMYQYFLNMQAKASGWAKTFGFRGGLLSRISDFNEPRVDAKKYFASIGLSAICHGQSGWHFTFLGGAGKVREKLSAYSHAGDVVDATLAENGAESQILLGLQFGNLNPLRLQRIEAGLFPDFVVNQERHLTEIGLIKDAYERVAELESIRSSELQVVASDLEKRMTEMRKAMDFAQQRRAETGKRLAWMTSRVEKFQTQISQMLTLVHSARLSVEAVQTEFSAIDKFTKENFDEELKENNQTTTAPTS